MKHLLTHSRMSTAKSCLKKHWFAYELGIRPDVSRGPLRVGSAVHLGLDLLAQGQDLVDACEAIRLNYAEIPQRVLDTDTVDEWMIECETCVQLLSGYYWWYRVEGGGMAIAEILASEQQFCIPLRNPETGRPTPNWSLAGKVDKIVRLTDSRVAIMEHKTCGEDLSPDSDYWKRLRLDQQISLYVIAARELGYDVQTIIYDVVRKPMIDPLSIPLLDADGLKIVLDADGQRVYLANGKPRQAGDKEKGWVLQSRRQTAAEYGDRLAEDIRTRPEFYFARQEIPRLNSDLDEFQAELWQQQQSMSDCKRLGRWFRNTNACLHPWRCDYFDLCCNGWSEFDGIPGGFVKLEHVHPELPELAAV